MMTASQSEKGALTPEMIEAGINVLEESGRLPGDKRLTGDDVLVAEVFFAMLRHRPRELPLEALLP